jgi:hypothetical protein
MVISDQKACQISAPFWAVLKRNLGSHDSSVGIALGYRLDDWDSRVRFPAGTGDFSLHHHVQNGSGAHPASYPMGTMPRSKNKWSYTSTHPIRLHGMVLS